MQWELSDEQQLFTSSLKEWLTAKYPAETVRAMFDAAEPGDFTRALIAEGWWGVGYPESSGGQGGGVLELTLAAREFGRAAVPDSQWLAAAIAAPLLSDSELAGQLNGTRLYAVAIRADRVPALQQVDGDSGSVTGTVGHVLGAAGADVFLVPVAGPSGTVIARVEAGDGVSLVSEDLLDRSRASATVTFERAPIVGWIDNSAAVYEIMSRAAVLTAADALGAAERMLELSVTYSKQRKQFGQFIGGFQAVKHAAAQMLVSVEAGYSATLYAGAALDHQVADADLIAAVAKAQVTASAAALADSALTVHGAIGYTWEHDLHMLYKRTKLDRVLFGPPGEWSERIAAELLDMQTS
jgi:alkylation response protein AidB-like acyl-CoA dehydrogenase